MAQDCIRASGIWCPIRFRPWAEPVLALHKWLISGTDLCLQSFNRRHDLPPHDFQQDLDGLVLAVDWEQHWKVSFHPPNTLQWTSPNIILFSHHSTSSPITLSTKTETKYHGVKIICDFQWDAYITDVCNKAWASSGTASRPPMRGCSIECIHTTCASPVWDPFTANNIKALEKVQRHATRWVKPDYRRSMCGHHVRNKVLDWPTLGQRRRQAHLTSFYKFHHGLIHIKSKHCPSLTDCRRRTTRHTHYLIYDIPRLNFLGPSRSGTAFCKKWPQHTPSAPLWPGSAAS